MKRSRTLVCWGSACTAMLLSMPVRAADVKQSSTASGAANSVDSPAFGYVVRGDTPELRAMLGVPGSARFSDPIALPEGTLRADVAPGHRWVLVIRSKDAAVYLPDSNAVLPLAGTGVPAAWAFSPSGSRLALFSADRGEVALISGLPNSPKVESTLKIAQTDSFAMADTGTFVYTAGNRILNSDGGLVYATAGVMAFEPSSDQMVVFDAATSSLTEVSIGTGSARVIAAGVAAPDRLFAGSDRLYAGDSVAGTVSLIEYADGFSVTQSVPVSRIAPSAISGTMVVSFDSDGPAWLVNSQGVSFIPAIVKQGVQ